MKPKEVIILGVPFTIEYPERQIDVDINKRWPLDGQIDYETCSIRIYAKGRPVEDAWTTIIHEVLHGISEKLKLALRKDEYHDDLDLLSVALTDVLIRNGWINTGDQDA